RVEPLVSRCVHPRGRATRPSARGRDLGRRSLVALTDEPIHGTRSVLRRESRGRSRMMNALAIGLLAGAGIILIVTGFAPAPAPLASEIAALYRRRPIVRPEDALRPRTRRVKLLGEPAADTSFGRSLAARYPSDLRVTGTTVAEHLAERAS